MYEYQRSFIISLDKNNNYKLWDGFVAGRIPAMTCRSVG